VRPVLDTTSAALAVQVAVQRRLSGAERLRIACEMSDVARQLALAGLRRRFPTDSEAELVRRWMRPTLPAGAVPGVCR
jgi:hypothetical protein